MADIDFENMSDEELSNMAAPPVAGEPQVEEPVVDETANEAVNAPAPAEEEDSLFTDGGAQTLEDGLDSSAQVSPADESENEDEGDSGVDHTEAEHTKSPQVATNAEPHDATKTGGAVEGATTVKSDAATELAKILAPFKANGREMQMNDSDEVIRLMQMGANYTQKLQQLQPNLKLMRMLENNGLLEEGKINFLIDLDKKDPAAVQKFLKDGNIDPLEVDINEESNYSPGNHKVTDVEMRFHDVLGDVQSTPTGRDTVVHMNETWDPASKDEAYRNPEIIRIIDTQRANGIYDQIKAEIDRQIALGAVNPSTPFIHAYKHVGDVLQQAGQLTPKDGSNQNPQPGNQSGARVMDVRPGRSKAKVQNGAQARAAMSARTGKSPNSASAFNPLTMTDEEIMAIPTLS